MTKQISDTDRQFIKFIVANKEYFKDGEYIATVDDILEEIAEEEAIEIEMEAKSDHQDNLQHEIFENLGTI